MKKNTTIFNKSKKVYEIISKIDADIYFEIETLCNGTRELLEKTGNRESDELHFIYVQQCLFLIEDILQYIKHPRKTIVRFAKNIDNSTCYACRVSHIKEVSSAQRKIIETMRMFKEASTFIFPEDEYPTYLLGLRTKMMFIAMVIKDLFKMERTKFNTKVIESKKVVFFEDMVLN